METPEGMFRDLCENAHDLIQSVSPDGRFLYVNRAWRQTLGYAPEEVSELRVFDVIHPDSREHCRKAMEALLAGGPPVRMEADFQDRDGKRIPVEGSATCRFENGEAVATRGIFRDIRQRRQAEVELDRLFQMSPDLLGIAGVDGYFRRVNPAFGTTLGYSEEELLGRPYIEFLHPDDKSRTIGEARRIAEGWPLLEFQNRVLAKDGTYHWLAWRSAPLPDTGLIYAVGRDITQHVLDQERLARQAEELARSNADLEQFAQVASHDLLAPLRSIDQLAEWLAEDLEELDREEGARHLSELQARVRRMETVVRDVLRYSRAGNEPGEVSLVDSGELVRGLTFLLAPPAGIQVIADPDLPVFETARGPLEQVLRNLIGNAVKHHHRTTGKVTIAATMRGELFEFSVSDDGPGIPAEAQERVFEMFQKLESNDEVEGSGIGLALVQRVVQSFGGTVSVESEVGKGSTFRFTWPRKPAAGSG